MTESPVVFSCEAAPLVGVLHRPVESASIGVLIVVGGPQYRVGSHRQFVLLGRALAASGFACFRFDYRGMGDSAAPLQNFLTIDTDIRAAIDQFMLLCPGLSGVVLWGLCDGASAALIYAPTDKRVCGVVAVNPWVRSDVTLAQARVNHYYRRRLFNPELWRKLFSGRFAWRRSVADITASLWRILRARAAGKRAQIGTALPSFQDRMASGWRQLHERVLIVLSGNDLTAAEFLELANNSPSWQPFPAPYAGCVRNVLDADHTFSRSEWNAQLTEFTLSWLTSVQSQK